MIRRPPRSTLFSLHDALPIFNEFGVRAVEPADIYDQDVDIFAPYALGAVINDDTISRLKVKVVAGSANNILDRKSTRLNSSHANISYAVFCLKKKKTSIYIITKALPVTKHTTTRFLL